MKNTGPSPTCCYAISRSAVLFFLASLACLAGSTVEITSPAGRIALLLLAIGMASVPVCLLEARPWMRRACTGGAIFALAFACGQSIASQRPLDQVALAAIRPWGAPSVQPWQSSAIQPHVNRPPASEIQPAKQSAKKPRTLWQRLKSWIKKPFGHTSPKRTTHSIRQQQGPKIGQILTFILLALAGLVIAYIALGFTSLLLVGLGLDFELSIAFFLFGLGGYFFLAISFWKKYFSVLYPGGKWSSPTNVFEDVAGYDNQRRPLPEDLPRYQEIHLHKQDVLACIYPTDDASQPLLIEFSGKSLATGAIPTTEEPICLELSAEIDTNNILRCLPAAEPAQHTRQVLRLVIEDGDIGREIFIRTDGELKLVPRFK